MRKTMAVMATLLASLSLMSCSLVPTGRDTGSDTGPSDTGPSRAGSSGAGPGCEWIPVAKGNGVVDTGLPPATGPGTGKLVLTLNTNLGVVRIDIDRARTPCTAASMDHLARRGYYNGTSCHRLVTDIFAVQCGDPTGTGYGSPAYRFADENLPSGRLPAYHEGDVALANTGEPSSNGGQFFFVYGSSPLPGDYTLFGKVTEGLDILKQVGAAGDDAAYAQESGGGHPLQPLTIITAEVTPA